HFRQHLDEAINGIRRLARRRPQSAYRMKRAIRVGMPVNNQQPLHKFFEVQTTSARSSRNYCAHCFGATGCSFTDCSLTLAGAATIVSPFPCGYTTAPAGCDGTV